MNRPWRLAALLCATAGCSLLQLDDFELATCDGDADCQPLNDFYGLSDDPCQQYRCAESARCVLRQDDLDEDGENGTACGGMDCNDDNPLVFPAAVELCDARDNDCDEQVDEGPTSLVQLSPVHEGAEALTSLSHDLTSGAMGWTDETTQGWLLGDAGPQAMTYGREANESNLMQPALLMDGSCPIPDPSSGVAGAVLGSDCNFAAVALATAASPSLFAAAINTRGCGEGQLRIGHVPSSAAPTVVLRGPRIRSNSYLGIDIDWSDRSCTGASRTSSELGVTNLQIAAQPESARALVVWSAASVRRPDQAPAEIETLEVLYESGGSGGETIGWVTASNDAVPQAAGVAVGGARVVAVDGQYLIAFVNVDGEIVLQAIQPAPDPAPVTPDASPNDMRPVGALTMPAPLAWRPGTNAQVSAVALAAGSDNTVVVAWVSGGGDLSLGRFDRRGQTIADVIDVGSRATGAPTVATQGNGWAVAWPTADGLAVRRFAQNFDAIDEAALALETSLAANRPLLMNAAPDLQLMWLSGDRFSVERAGVTCADQEGM